MDPSLVFMEEQHEQEQGQESEVHDFEQPLVRHDRAFSSVGLAEGHLCGKRARIKCSVSEGDADSIKEDGKGQRRQDFGVEVDLLPHIELPQILILQLKAYAR